MLFPKPKTVRDEKYKAWLREQPCAFCGRPEPSEVSHHGQRGWGMKASDHEALPSCHLCHMRWHSKLCSPHTSFDHMDRYEKRDEFARLAAEHRSRYTEGN